MKLYIDVDGVLLGKDAKTGIPSIANNSAEFLSFCLKNFDCYWLTTHCRGDSEIVLNYLRPYSNDAFLALASKIKATNFRTFKTEALSGDFLWIDDQPTAYELQVLDENNWFDRWYEVNTRKDMDALTKLIPLLLSRVSSDAER